MEARNAALKQRKLARNSNSQAVEEKNDSDDMDDLQVLEKFELSDSESENEEYEVLDENYNEMLDDNDSSDEDLMTALMSMRKTGQTKTEAPQETVTHVRPSVIDDFIRNFLVKVGMSKTFETFNAEWFELQSKGRLRQDLLEPVPDIYLRNHRMDEELTKLQSEVEKMREIAEKAQGTWDKFKRERDFHRMHHKRVVQEKSKLLTDLRRLKDKIKAYDPLIQELKRKYQVALKEKMLARLDRDKHSATAEALEQQLSRITGSAERRLDLANGPDLHSLTSSSNEDKKKKTTKSTKKSSKSHKSDAMSTLSGTALGWRSILEQNVVNPYLELEFCSAPVDNWKSCTSSATAHINSVSAIAMHPSKMVVATASDDHCWKIWNLPSFELVMTGEGHTSWLADIDFHPSGVILATASGDCSVRIWHAGRASCEAVFSDHTQPVWASQFHCMGDILASCSMDHSTRLWDLNSGVCRQTLRGHVDSVNSIHWMPYSFQLTSASGDKTVSIWDIRTGLCAQTFFGHGNSCNDVKSSLRGDLVVSCDADGIVKAWDVRMVKEVCSIEGGRYPHNSIDIDRSGTFVSVASDDGGIRIYNIRTQQLVHELRGHEDSVQCVKFMIDDSALVSGGSDCCIKLWS